MALAMITSLAVDTVNHEGLPRILFIERWGENGVPSEARLRIVNPDSEIYEELVLTPSDAAQVGPALSIE